MMIITSTHDDNVHMCVALRCSACVDYVRCVTLTTFRPLRAFCTLCALPTLRGAGNQGLNSNQCSIVFENIVVTNERSLTSAELPCHQKPPSLLRDDNKRPYGLSLSPSSNGQFLVSAGFLLSWRTDALALSLRCFGQGCGWDVRNLWLKTETSLRLVDTRRDETFTQK